MVICPIVCDLWENNGMLRRIKRLLLRKDYFCGKDVYLTNVELHHKCNIAYGADISNSSIGKFTSIGRRTTVRNSLIGNFCSISYNVTIGANGHPIDRVSGSAAFYQSKFGLVDFGEKIDSKGTIVGHSVWIGCNAVIMEGVQIGNGAVVGAGAIVTKNVKPYEVVAGIPAVHLKYRFTDKIIENIEESQWWEKDDQFYRNNLNLFKCSMSLDTSEKLKKISGGK